MLLLQSKRNQVTFLEKKMNYHFEMIKGYDISLIRSQTLNFLPLKPEIRPLQGFEMCTSQWELFTVFGQYFL